MTVYYHSGAPMEQTNYFQKTKHQWPKFLAYIEFRSNPTNLLIWIQIYLNFCLQRPFSADFILVLTLSFWILNYLLYLFSSNINLNVIKCIRLPRKLWFEFIIWKNLLFRSCICLNAKPGGRFQNYIITWSLRKSWQLKFGFDKGKYRSFLTGTQDGRLLSII